jgi:hypothetical protein
MARGWESKDVESQQELRQSRTTAAAPKSEADSKRASLLLSRVRVEHDLEAARHPRHREQLRAALAHLEAELAKLD